MIRDESRLSRRPWGITRKKRGTLASVNERLLTDDKYLHPKKGFRKVSPKLSMASTIVSAVKAGKARYELQEVRNLIREVGQIGLKMTLAGDYT